MLSIQLDIEIEKFQNDLITDLPRSGNLPVNDLISALVIEQFEARLQGLTLSQDVIRYKVESLRNPSRSSHYPPSLRKLIEHDPIDLGYIAATIVTKPESNLHLLPPVNLEWLVPIQIKFNLLNTIKKYIIRMYSVGLRANVLEPAYNILGSQCECAPDLLVPYIDGVWDWVLRFICKVCGKSYICECFRKAIEIHYPKAELEKSKYREGGWPHKFITAVTQSEFRPGICHLCRDIHSELRYCHPMYGSKIMVHYGPYVVRTSIENQISQQDAEDEIRGLLGISQVSSKWISEIELLKIVREIFPDKKVIPQASPEWLGLQRMDIFMPELRLAIEYQGRQHYEPVDFFGGEEGFLRAQERDRKKARLCYENGITLVYFRFDEELTSQIVLSRIKRVLQLKKEIS